MATYTFIMEYRGGTYISQVKATSINKAIRQWAYELPVNEIKHFGPKMKQQLVHDLDHDEYGIYKAVALTGLANAWSVSVPLPISAGTTINAVKTDVK